MTRLRGHTTYVHTVSWSAVGERIASPDEAGNVRIWDAHTGVQTLALSLPRAIPIPNGMSLGCVGFGGATSAKIWSAKVDQSSGFYW